MEGLRATLCFASTLTGSHNKRVSGFGASHLRPNPAFGWTSDTRQPLGDISLGGYFKKVQEG